MWDWRIGCVRIYHAPDVEKIWEGSHERFVQTIQKRGWRYLQIVAREE